MRNPDYRPSIDRVRDLLRAHESPRRLPPLLVPPVAPPPCRPGHHELLSAAAATLQAMGRRTLNAERRTLNVER